MAEFQRQRRVPVRSGMISSAMILTAVSKVSVGSRRPARQHDDAVIGVVRSSCINDANLILQSSARVISPMRRNRSRSGQGDESPHGRSMLGTIGMTI